MAYSMVALEVERRRRRRARLSLLDFVPDIANAAEPYQSPSHLAPLTECLERMRSSEQLVLLSVPPRHAKTETVLHYFAQRLLQQPSAKLAYISYGADIAREKGGRALALARRAHVKLSPGSCTPTRWQTVDGGGLWTSSIGGELTARGFDLIVVDDPHKNRAHAESPLHRRTVHEWYTSTAFTRLEPGGSMVVSHTRWHPNDLIGQLSSDAIYTKICLPALSETTGRPLWPERWTLEALERRRGIVGEYDWDSIYQQRPRPRSGSIFRDTALYESVPSNARVVIGLDLSYSERTYADWSVAVVMAECDGFYYILEVVRRQCEAPDFLGTVKALVAKWSRPRKPAIFWHASGTEKGTGDFFVRAGLPLTTLSATSDKFTRAQSFAAAWNAGKVKLPVRAGAADARLEGDAADADLPWLSDYLSEVLSFTGISDPNDDQVDASVSAFDKLDRPDARGGNALPPQISPAYDSRGLGAF